MNIQPGRLRAPTLMSVAAALGALALSGCASFSRDGGFDAVAGEAHARVQKEVRWPRTEQERARSDAQVAQLLAEPLSAEDAVQIALLNNHMLQASFEELGISEADLVQSGRLPNPRFTLRHVGAGGQVDIEEAFTFNILSLLTAPYAHEVEKRRFAAVQSSVLLTVVQMANDTRQAYITAVAARESVRYMQQVKNTAEVSGELTQRMVTAGNLNRLDQARERGFHTDASLGLTRAELTETAARENLTRLLGLSEQPPALRLAERLPELPQAVEAEPDIERAALEDRIDLRLMRTQIDELARRLGLTRATRFVSVVEIGPARVLQGSRSEPYQKGYELNLEIPLFDGGGVRVKKAQALYAQAVDRFTQAVIVARSQIRLAYSTYRATFELARQQRDEVLPARKQIAEQNLLHYNASLISVFDLLTDARDQVLSVDAYIRSVRDFWIAKSELDTALLGNSNH